MTRKILLPTDFSSNALRAINYALELYKDEPCLFYLLNVFTVSSNVMDSLINMEPGSELYETAKSNSEIGLSNVLNSVAFGENGNPKHSFQTISTFNSPLEAIKHAVEKNDIELIVMGTKGETKSRTSVFGSVAVNVMEKVRNCPVIVVPELAKLQLPKEIVFPTSYKTHFKKRELNYLIDIAQKCKASIKVLHVANEEILNEEQFNGKKLLAEYFEGVNHSFHFLSHNSVPEAINCFVESRESEMVAFINKKHAFFGSIFTQPLVKEISFDSKVPILVMHDLRN
ncbi:universal stress protein [Confluentibacter lentus]|uniref:universal stress protein n=1 Tax=Confluentibacter lentus TaxID=1699412 RepID=UPI000C285C55|nr:universal stress protein [Confluentibacter lentus]